MAIQSFQSTSNCVPEEKCLEGIYLATEIVNQVMLSNNELTGTAHSSSTGLLPHADSILSHQTSVVMQSADARQGFQSTDAMQILPSELVNIATGMVPQEFLRSLACLATSNLLATDCPATHIPARTIVETSLVRKDECQVMCTNPTLTFAAETLYLDEGLNSSEGSRSLTKLCKTLLHKIAVSATWPASLQDTEIHNAHTSPMPKLIGPQMQQQTNQSSQLPWQEGQSQWSLQQRQLSWKEPKQTQSQQLQPPPQQMKEVPQSYQVFVPHKVIPFHSHPQLPKNTHKASHPYKPVAYLEIAITSFADTPSKPGVDSSNTIVQNWDSTPSWDIAVTSRDSTPSCYTTTHKMATQSFQSTSYCVPEENYLEKCLEGIYLATEIIIQSTGLLHHADSILSQQTSVVMKSAVARQSFQYTDAMQILQSELVNIATEMVPQKFLRSLAPAT